MITPQSLKQGDTVAIVSPAGALSDYSIAEQAIERLRSWGLNVIMSSHTLTREGYYSGNIKERTDDIVNAGNVDKK